MTRMSAYRWFKSIFSFDSGMVVRRLRATAAPEPELGTVAISEQIHAESYSQ